jgi:hypothetical protein
MAVTKGPSTPAASAPGKDKVAVAAADGNSKSAMTSKPVPAKSVASAEDLVRSVPAAAHSDTDEAATDSEEEDRQGSKRFKATGSSAATPKDPAVSPILTTTGFPWTATYHDSHFTSIVDGVS